MIDFAGFSLDTGMLLTVAAATAVGGFLRGFVGFGGALAMMPPLALAFGPKTAVAAASLIGLPAVFQLLPEALRHADRSRVGPVAAAILVAVPVGTLILTSVPPQIMTGSIGVLVMLMALLTWRRPSQRLRPRWWINIGAGLGSGLLQGAAGIGGPPTVAVLLAQGGEPRQVRADVLAATATIALCGAASNWWFGLFTLEAATAAALLLPVFVGSTWLGSRYFDRGGDRHFRVAALGVLLVIGLAAVVASLKPLLTGG